ncbi:hypothetical protein SAMN04487912_102365 [Arthrobacter sp. cf158]|uniref:hypothetical protein n=1 Tax=Arthrobacter sp. cf158 TaxID=1761744 RepID=UPI00089CD95F|nr:hypothetical protein [Arthrobacter sp. cf158]SDW33374.1 hypothetical protein SAMN04487912_102365 [Arthrobacter sp. cf158]
MSAKPWACHTEGSDPYHVWPLDDLIKHDTNDDDGNCACGPTVTPVEGDNGYIGWVITHHSLDGRELHE